MIAKNKIPIVSFFFIRQRYKINAFLKQSRRDKKHEVLDNLTQAQRSVGLSSARQYKVVQGGVGQCEVHSVVAAKVATLTRTPSTSKSLRMAASVVAPVVSTSSQTSTCV